MTVRLLTATLLLASAPAFASNVIHSAPTELGYTEHPEHAGVAKTRSEVLADLAQSQKDGSWAFHRIGAPLPVPAGKLTREQVVADLKRAQAHPTWSARRVGASVSME